VSGNARRPHVKVGRPSIKGPALTERNAGRNLNKLAHLRISPRILNVEVRGSRQFHTSTPSHLKEARPLATQRPISRWLPLVALC